MAKVVPVESVTVRNGRGGGNSRSVEPKSREIKQNGERSQFSDDTRLSRLMRRIIREEDRRLSALKQLHEYLLAENAKVHSKQVENVLEALCNVLSDRGSVELKNEIVSCIAICGTLMSDNPPRFFKMMFGKVNASATNDSLRASYLKATLETLQSVRDKKAWLDALPGIMNNLQSALEGTVAPDVFIVTVNIIQHIVKVHPVAFESHFRDTVDILVGWHIDSTQKESLIKFAADALIFLHEFWVEDLVFSVTLLGQFLEDMEAYTEDLCVDRTKQSLDPDLPPVEECIAKIASLIRVYMTGVRSLGNHFSPSVSSVINTNYIVDNLNRIVQCILTVCGKLYSESLIYFVNECILELLQVVHGEAADCTAGLTEFLVFQCRVGRLPPLRNTVSYLKVLLMVIQDMGSKLPASFIDSILSKGSCIPHLRFHLRASVQHQVMEIYQALLSLKNVLLLEAAYKWILLDVQQAYNAILELLGASRRLSIVHEYNVLVRFTADQAKHCTLFLLGAMTEIGIAKSSIIGMWALSPSLFDLLSQHMDPTEEDIVLKFPDIHYAVLYALHVHCNRHGNFISTSCLLSSQVAQTSGHLSKIILVLTKLLRSQFTCWKSRKLGLRWCKTVLQCLQSQHLQLFTKPQFCNLLSVVIQSGFSSEEEVCILACQCIQLIITNVFPLRYDILQRCIDVCVFQLTHQNEAIRTKFEACFQKIQYDIITSASRMLLMSSNHLEMSIMDENGSSRKASKLKLQEVRITRCSHIGQLPMGTFHTNNFRAIMAYVLNGEASDRNFEWLTRLYHSCQRSDKLQGKREENSPALRHLAVDDNLSLLWFWATYEAAQYCVMAKLRTPFGKPQETFRAIESALGRHVLQKNKPESENDRKLSDNSNKDCEPLSTQFRVHLLLNFMENLDKLMYNSYEGSAVAMNTVPKVVRTFFRTNRTTCQEWLFRVRSSIIQVALQAGQASTAVRHSFELLKDFKESNSQSVDIECVVCWLVEALVTLRCPDAIHGLHVWLNDKKFAWVKSAVDMASGRYEVAANDFMFLISDIAPPKSPSSSGDSAVHSSPPCSPASRRLVTPRIDCDPYIANYITQQVSNCYMFLNDMEEALLWQESVKKMRSDKYYQTSSQSLLFLQHDVNYLRALSSFDSGHFEQADDILKLMENNNVNIVNAWHSSQQLISSEKLLLKAANDLALRKSSSMVQFELEQVLSTVKGLIRTSAMEYPPRILPTDVTVLHCTDLLQQFANQKMDVSLQSNFRLDATEHTSQHIGVYTRYMEFVNQRTDSSDESVIIQSKLADLFLVGASLARKQQNYKLCQILLNKLSASMVTLSELRPVHMIGNFGKLESLPIVYCMGLHKEMGKLLNSLGQPRQAVEAAIAGIFKVLQECDQNGFCKRKCDEQITRTLLNVIKWLQQDPKHLGTLVTQLAHVDKITSEEEVSSSATNLASLLQREAEAIETTEEDWKILPGSVVGETDVVLGKLYRLGTLVAPNFTKSWFAFAGWCYKWGRKSVDNASHGSVELLQEEKATILSVLPETMPPKEKELILAAMSKIHGGINTELEDITDQDQSLYDDGNEEMRRHLLSACRGLLGSETIIENLLSIWHNVVHRVYYYYQLSAKAYFMYLKLNGQLQDEHNHEDGNITATLRLLRLVVKHAGELRQVLEGGLASTPTTPWKGIIPQLFSRLNHPEPYVRQSVSDLLCRVAQDAPHLIVYPAVVGCSLGKTDTQLSHKLLSKYLTAAADENSTDMPSQDYTPDEKVDEADSSTAVLSNCFTVIVNMLSQQSPQMIAEMQLLVQELRRITLLWDELWLGTLNQHHSDINRRLVQLDSEVKKVMCNMALSKDEKAAIIRQKHDTVLKPTLHVLNQLQMMTSQAPETEHEKWFQDQFGEMIANALDRLANPPKPSNPASSWQLFDQVKGGKGSSLKVKSKKDFVAVVKKLHQKLQQRAQKRTSLALTMKEISSVLAGLKNTAVPMPGINTSNQIITIESVVDSLQILPTKTKPKKLVFCGSDGKRYTYLFKGLEDLHLDERIMQFLTIVNNMFAKSNRSAVTKYHARHYSVTPLGPRSGLIQWVDGATPLFGLYKRWQQREVLAHMLKSQQANASAQPLSNPTVPRPSEVYYSKLTPALKEQGITQIDNRKEWPLSVLCSVMESLIKETPRDLLARELWCSSSSASDWWHITQQYSRSTGVMSMIGYIIGLGDRHLDNILVDLTTGEVVHIDYNVCFEKGKSLRVPERIPFRMTQNIEAALGVTGIEGIFRASCEHVIRMMRKGRETLLTLLEAFVYDPLVDWTTGNESGYAGAFYGGGVVAMGTVAKQTKQDMEKEITYSMFSIRIAEMKSYWIKNRDEMQGSLPQLKQLILNFASSLQNTAYCQQQMEALQERQALLEAAKKDLKHELYTLHERYRSFATVLDTETMAKGAVQEKLAECEQWLNLHNIALCTIRGQGIALLFADISKPFDLGPPSYLSTVDFLNSAGQGHMVQQCEQLDEELTSLVQQRHSLLRTCMELLHLYGTVASNFPPSYMEQNRAARWHHWLTEILHNWTQEMCQNTLSEFHQLFGLDNVQTLSSCQAMLSIELKLQSILADTNAKLLKVVERNNPEQLDITVLESQKYIDSFVEENGKMGSISLTTVLVTALCALSKRYLVMEGAAAAAADRLMDLTSRDGDWFLDELCSMSANISQLVEQLQKHYTLQDDLQQFLMQVTPVLAGTHQVYMSLQELNFNFRKIILPETMKNIQCKNHSVLMAVEMLNETSKLAGVPLDSLLGHLDTKMRNIFVGIEKVDSGAVSVVPELRKKFNEHLEGEEVRSSELTAGQMLLMCFNGLFIRLADVYSEMLTAFNSLQTPSIWRKIDLIREARSLQTGLLSEETFSLLEDIFFVKKLQAMQEFFGLCSKFSNTLFDKDSSGEVFDDEQLAKPIKHFVAEFVRKKVIGIPSQLLGYLLCIYLEALGINVTAEIELKDIGAESKVAAEDLCKKVVDLNLRDGNFQHTHLSQASTQTSSLDTLWRKQDLARRLDACSSLLRLAVHSAQLQLARFQWFHEDTLVQAHGGMFNRTSPNRGTLMSDIRKTAQGILSIDPAILSAQEKWNQLETSISQRLKWAAGANPSLQETLQNFEQTAAQRNRMIMLENKLSADVGSLCNSILHFEALRTRTPEAINGDRNFLSLLNSCLESCALRENCSKTVSSLEVELVEMVPLPQEESAMNEWIDKVNEVNSERINDIEQELNEKRNLVEGCRDAIRTQVTAIRNLLSTHHKLMSDVRSILKTMAKYEEESGEKLPAGSVRDYINVYRNFSENFTSALKNIMSDETPANAANDIDALLQQIPHIYDKLLEFAVPLSDNADNPNEDGDAGEKISAASTSATTLKPGGVARDPRTGKALQERNSYAIGVWRKIKLKLDGRDPDTTRRLSIPEQVDFVIKSATNLENLAVLYEGWTPWV